MTTLHLVAPEHRGTVGGFEVLFEPGKPDAVATFRANLVAGATSLVSPDPTNAEVIQIPGNKDVPDLRALIHRPPVRTGHESAIIYLHAGGMIAGTPDMMAGASDRIARETGSVVIAPDYRLAPENRAPAALEDAYSTLVWLHLHAKELGIDPAHVSVMGDSAGGCLAAGLSLLARDRGTTPALRAQFLLYPTLNHRTGTTAVSDEDPLTGEFVWTRKRNRAAWELSKSNNPITKTEFGYYSPAFATDLSKLPPAFILIPGLDLLRDEGIAYAQRLMRASVAVDLVVYAGAVHAFDILSGDVSVRARNDTLAAIKRLG